MRILVSGASRTVARLALRDPRHLGVLLTPRSGNAPLSVPAGLPYAADNDCYTGLHEGRFRALLRRLEGLSPAWVAAPDVVADARATASLFEEWEPVVRAHGLPVALVAQDGLESLPVPWGRIDALFLGGSTGWKLGPHAHALAAEAKRRGKWLHMGRCSTRRRMEVAARMGCDSVDGTVFSRWADRRLPDGLRWLRAAEKSAAGQGTLF